MRVYIDLTEFLGAPHRTGIQRVCEELCRLWPSDIELQPVKFAPGAGMLEISPEAMQLIRNYFGASPDDTEWLQRLKHVNDEADSQAHVVTIRSGERVLVPELFYDPNRLEFFDGLTDQDLEAFYFIVYDFLPLTHPQYFPTTLEHQVICRYFRLIRNACNVSFISRSTQETYLNRICRVPRDAGVVLRLGSDGLAAHADHSVEPAEPPLFVVVGTVEPRKNHGLLLHSLVELLDRQAPSFQLTFAGRMGHVSEALSTRIRSLAAENGWFRFVENPDDQTLRGLVESARASIFLSSAEGFGLPPCESLWLGVPVIASQGIPSLEDIGESGVHLVQPLNRENIQQAVVAFLDDDYHGKKMQEASRLSLPTWQLFALQVAHWVADR